jgi:class 3 adenylate cyclase
MPSRVGRERRWVSVLFCDLVGYTSFADAKDPEVTRELLSGYFELAQRVVARYGGKVEKYIGDAVMAVWGEPAWDPRRLHTLEVRMESWTSHRARARRRSVTRRS